ncbi:MAG TPA: sigma factor-like helix-turn-helix DNA-binding protein [Kofleriaceae bacterium]
MDFAPDLATAAACLAGDAKAIADLDLELVSAATPAIAAIDSGRDFIDECLQKLRTSLLVGGEDNVPRLTHYAGRGPLRAWIGVAAARTALMVRRTRQRQREVAEPEDWSRALVTISTADPELELLKRQYAEAFSSAFHDAIEELEPRLRTALRMSFVEGLSIDDIGATYAVHRATAARWITRACDDVFETTRTLLQERLALTPTELDRMTSLVRSQLDVSVSQLLPANV